MSTSPADSSARSQPAVTATERKPQASERPGSQVEARLEEMLAEYGPWLEQTVARLCPRNLGIDPGEVHQLVVLRLWKVLRSETVIENETSYLHRVVSTVTIDAIRKARRRREVSLDAPASGQSAAAESPDRTNLAEHMPSEEPDPFRHASSGELRESVMEALSELSDNRRRAAVLYLRGFTTSQAAELLGWSEAKVRNLAWRGMQEVKRHLEKAGQTS